MIEIPTIVYVILTVISAFFILSTILNFFEITPDVYLIFIMYIIVLVLFYIFLPIKVDKHNIFSI